MKCKQQIACYADEQYKRVVNKGQIWYQTALIINFDNTFLITGYGLVKSWFLLHYNLRLIQMTELLSLQAISLYMVKWTKCGKVKKENRRAGRAVYEFNPELLLLHTNYLLAFFVMFSPTFMGSIFKMQNLQKSKTGGVRLTTALKLHDPVSKNNFDFGWFCYDKEN